MADAIDVARHILHKAQEKGFRLDPMQLQKMLYFSHGWMLGLCERPLFSEPVEAWPYGPVVESVYHEFKAYGSGDLPDSEARQCDGLDESINKIIDQVISIYGKYSGPILSGMTHEKESPWEQTYKSGYRSVSISNAVIHDYFRGLKASNRIY